jgi:putative hydrolase of the HAD superfamily
MIKAVIFDFGNVISLAQEPWVMEKLASLAGLPVQTMDSLVWKYRAEYDRGTISGKEYYRTLLVHGGLVVEDEVLEQMVQIDLESWTHINPDTVQLMEHIKQAGYTLGILSNMPHEFLHLARMTLPVFALPDVCVFSCELGFIKPEPAIYQTLLSLASCKPEEAVFFDDVQANIDAARLLGINAYLWNNPETARNTLHQLGIL